jgi:DNA segregation ATPase FtsK/SpoIIIE, S-DNA-T family
MINRILKIELVFLAIVTVLSFYTFYNMNSFPDNTLSISSQTSEVGAIGYYYYSFLAMCGLLIGPWPFVPFVLFTFLFILVFSKRSSWADVFTPFLLMTASLLWTYFLFPKVVGAGLLFYLNKTLSPMILGGLASVSSLLLFLIVFKGISFKLIGVNLGQSFGVLFNPVNKLSFRPLARIRHYFKVDLPLFFKKKIEKKKDEEKEKQQEQLYIDVPLSSVEDQLSDQPEIDVFGEGPVKEVKEQEDSTLSGKTSFSSFFKNKKSDNSLAKNLSKKNMLPAKQVPKNVSEVNYGMLASTGIMKRKRPLLNKVEDNYFEEIVERIEDKLEEFKIEGKIINCIKGPVIDTFELELGPGVKVSKITGITEDLSLALYGVPIRIVYPLKGKVTIGIEVPCKARDIIYLDEVLNSRDFNKNEYHLPLAMGRDAYGKTLIVDLASMPHMLVAGATGAGKSVFVNTILVSLLVKCSPKEMKLILIDPKQLELALYSGLPHLVMPVITDALKASLSLKWACHEMERRYTIMKNMGVRNIEGLNLKIKNSDEHRLQKVRQFYPLNEQDNLQLPYLVIIIDEFADLIHTKAGKEIEGSVCRLAAKARAAGIHLVVATQRPSVDVITGLIKSNFPTRVSFRVTSSIDSRTILNSMGAEKLLGKGDLLYKFGVETLRAHSSYVDEDEIECLVEKLGEIEQSFNEGAINFMDEADEINSNANSGDDYAYGSHLNPGTSNGGADELYQEAVKLVVQHRVASASMLQRRLKIGYNRAANLIEELEDRGVVGEARGSKPRKVLGHGDRPEL